jgi:arylsulfatase A-like enzyme
MGAGAATLAIPGCLRAQRRHGQTENRQPPSFVFILVDDLGWTDLACYGSTFYETPNIDRLASQGVRFTNAYTASPVCSPTRASIMTGKHPARLGITDWIPGLRPRDRKLLGPPIRNELPLEEVTIAEALQEAGYATFFAGKWHLGGPGFHPEQQGFDINQGGHNRGSPPGGYYVPYKNPKLEDGPEGEYLPDRLTDESIRFLERHGDRPFLLFLSFYTVHTPIQPCRRHVERFRRKAAALPEAGELHEGDDQDVWTRQRQNHAAYASMIHALDENVGRLLARLEALALADETVVVFMSDNGGLATQPWKGSPTANRPLRAGKGWCYEGGIRVPMIIRALGVTRAGKVCHVPVVSMDFYATMLELAGLELRPQQHCDGVSLVPLLRGGDAPEREALYWHFPHPHSSGWTPGAAVRAGDWKLIEFDEEQAVELYNLGNDVGERHDLAEQMPEKKAELLDRLHDWQKRVGAKLPRPNPGYRPEED